MKMTSKILHRDTKVNRPHKMTNGAIITKTRLYNFDPLKPHFYIVKLGFTEVYIIFLISAQKSRMKMKSKILHRDTKVNRPHKMTNGAIITKTRLYNFDPLKPHFYIVKLGFTEVYIIFLISAQKHILWVLVRTALSRRL